MKKIITATLLGGAIVGSLLGAGTANATVERFQSRAQAEMPYVVSQYGMPAVLNEGYKICGYEAQGITGTSEVVDAVVAEMPMSRTGAIQLKVLAEFHLGC